jgi:hypothetical protein
MSHLNLEDELRLLSDGPRTPVIDADQHPIIARINILAGNMMRVLGPIFWAAIVLLWFVAESSPR